MDCTEKKLTFRVFPTVDISSYVHFLKSPPVELETFQMCNAQNYIFVNNFDTHVSILAKNVNYICNNERDDCNYIGREFIPPIYLINEDEECRCPSSSNFFESYKKLRRHPYDNGQACSLELTAKELKHVLLLWES